MTAGISRRNFIKGAAATAAAVSIAGGLGILALTTREELQSVKAMSDKPFAVSPSAADEETVAMLKEGNAVRGCPLIVLPTGLINSMPSKVSVYYGLCGSWAMRA